MKILFYDILASCLTGKKTISPLAALEELVEAQFNSKNVSDFVNLSSNLVGLDESMARIEEPLRRYSDRAKEVRRSLQEALAALKAKLAEREALQAKRVALQVRCECALAAVFVEKGLLCCSSLDFFLAGQQLGLAFFYKHEGRACCFSSLLTSILDCKEPDLEHQSS